MYDVLFFGSYYRPWNATLPVLTKIALVSNQSWSNY